MEFRYLALFLFISYFVGSNLLASDVPSLTRESDCTINEVSTSLDPIDCSKVDEDLGDCECYANKFSSLVNEKERLPLVNKELGRIALNSLKENFRDIANNAKELNLMGFKLMEGKVVSSCSMDRLGTIVHDSCKINNKTVNARLSSYFGEEVGITNLTDFTKRVYGIFEEQIPLRLGASSMEKCLSGGEVQTIANRTEYRDNLVSFSDASKLKNVSDMINGYNGGRLWDRLNSSEYKTFVNSNPLLKLIFEHDVLSQEFIKEGAPLDEKSIKKFLNKPSNVSSIRDSVANKCENTLRNIATLICKSPKTSTVSNRIFNQKVLNYDPEMFAKGYSVSKAKFQAMLTKKQPDFFLERHISFCQAKLKKFSCEENEQSCIDVDNFLEDLTHSMGSEAFYGKGSEGRENATLNQNFCPIYFCSNLKEVVAKGVSVCKKTNNPDRKAILNFFTTNKNLPCPSLLSITNFSPYNCPADGTLTDDFKEFMRVMDEKMGIGKPVVAQSGTQENGSIPSSGYSQESGSASRLREVKEEKGMFDSFVDNFKGKFATLVGGGEEVTVEKLKGIAPPRPATEVAGGSQNTGSGVASSSTNGTGGSDRSNSTAGNTKGTGNVAGGAQGAGGGAGLQNGMAPQNGRFFPGNQAPTSPYPYPYSRAGQGSSASVNPNVSPVTDRALTAQDYFNDMQRLDEMEKELENKKKEYAGLQKERGTSAKERALKDEIAKLSKQIEEEKTKKTNTALGSNNTPYKNTTASSGSRAASNRSTTPSSGGSFGTKPSRGSYQVDNSLPDQDQVAGGAQASVGKSGRSPASAGIAGTTGPGAGGAGGRASASSSNNLPFNEGGSALTKAQADQQAAKVIVIKANEIDLSLQKIDIAAAIRKNNVKLEKGAPFKIDFDGQGTIEFVPQYEKNVFKGYYVPQPADSDLILFLKEAPYWRNVTVKGLNSQLPKRSR